MFLKQPISLYTLGCLERYNPSKKHILLRPCASAKRSHKGAKELFEDAFAAVEPPLNCKARL
jgi:hypothetical protein